MDSVIQTSGLTRRFGAVVAVQDLDLTVAPGRFYGFLGPNGAGKSTTIKMLTGLLAPSSGSVRIFGRDLRNPAEAIEIKRRIGVVPENLALFENLTAREYLLFIGRIHRLPIPTIQERSEELLRVLELEVDDRKIVLEFSHGMKKKLSLAAAVLPRPDLLFLDEPFEGVDAVTSRAIRDILLRFVDRGGTVFLTSHILEIVERLCTHVGIIARGRLVLQAAMQELKSGRTLEERFLEVVGAGARETQTLSWLEGGS